MKKALHRIAALSMFAAPCLYATDFIVVTTLVDEDNGNIDPAQGTGVSLREAIRHPGDPFDLALDITFAPELAGGTILLTQGQLTAVPEMQFVRITGPITISRPASAPLGRILEVHENLSLALNRVRITGGDAGTGGSGGSGGGILLFGGLDMGSCEIIGNRAKNGGGIYVASGGYVSSMIECNFEGNLAGFNGGAVDNQGSIGTEDVVVRCTFSANSAAQGGGAIQQQGTNESSKTLLLDHCTLSGNTAQFGGAIDGDGASVIELRSCTITNNSATKGGGIEQGAAGGEIHLHNSIVAGNSATAPLGPNQGGPDIFGPITDQSNAANLIGSLEGVTGTYTGLVGAPMLGPLANHGGITKTHAPLPGSPAIDAGGLGSGEDQRGAPRSLGVASDLGSVEVPAGPLVVTELQGALESDVGTLGRAVRLALSGDVIQFDPTALAAPILSGQASEGIVVDRNLTIDASMLNERFPIQSFQSKTALEVGKNCNVEVRNLAITENQYEINENLRGGGVFNSGSLKMINCTVQGCIARFLGGGIFSDGPLLELVSCKVSDNALISESGNVTEQSFGAGICVQGGTAVIQSTEVMGNVIWRGGESGWGAGIANLGGTLICESSIIHRNRNDFDGGGGIFSENGVLTLKACTVAGNQARDDGGGLESVSSTVLIEDCLVSHNSSEDRGGGLSIKGTIASPSVTTVHRTTFGGNGSLNGGSIESRCGTDCQITMTNCTIAGNSSGDAGGIYASGGGFSIIHCTITGNRGGTGGFYSDTFDAEDPGSTTVFTSNSVIAGNHGSYDDDVTFDGGEVLHGGVNFIGVDSGAYGLGTQGVDYYTGDPGLLDLRVAGGLTPVIPPAPDSPLVDAGGVGSSDEDQRGFSRSQGTAPDIGAFETGNSIPTVVVDADFDENNGSGVGFTSLREAIEECEPGTRIRFATLVNGQGNEVGVGDLTLHSPIRITKNVAIDGAAMDGAVMPTSTAVESLFVIEPGAFVDIRHMTFQGMSNSSGGSGTRGILNQGEISVHRNLLHQFEAAGDGGAILNEGIASIRESQILNNECGGSGGGIHSDDSSHLFVSRSTLAGNSAVSSGGGISVDRASLLIDNTTLHDNAANSGGGLRCIAVETSPVDYNALVSNLLDSCTVTGNSADVSGGGISILGTQHVGGLKLQNCIVAGNSSGVSDPEI